MWYIDRSDNVYSTVYGVYGTLIGLICTAQCMVCIDRSDMYSTVYGVCGTLIGLIICTAVYGVYLH